MASPSIRSSAVTNGSTATTTPAVSLPATVRAGDTLYGYFRTAAAGSVTWPADWTRVVDASPDGSTGQISLAWKKADGSESGTTITLGAGSGKFAAIVRAVRDAADPTVRAPELSTVAIGTTGEPNATTVTPTGGAKDYLFDTVFLMEGEQTGITANPTGYTLDQQFANSGTAGIVTTNCTIGAVGRAANAASEDAGVWDVTGTLDDSSAYTVAFHPADVVPTLLVSEWDPVNPTLPRRLATAVLTLAASLILTTLAVPVGRQVVEVPARQVARATVQTIAAPPLPLTSGDRPFAQSDWPVPLSPPRLIVSISSEPDDSTSSEALESTSLGVPPRARELGYLASVSPPNLLTSSLAPVSETAPFAQIDWPVSTRRLPRATMDATASVLVSTLAVPIGASSGDVPARARTNALTWTQDRKSYYADEVPAHQIDWPLPTRTIVPALTWLQSRPVLAVDAALVGVQESGVIGRLAARGSRLETGALLVTTLAVPVGSTTSAVPRSKPAPFLGWTQDGLRTEPVPFGSGLTDLPARPRLATISWTQSRPTFAVDAMTVGAASTDLPNPRKVPTITWTQDGRREDPAVFPVGRAETTLPLRKSLPTITWTQARPTFAVDDRLVGSQSSGLPTYQVSAAPTWLQDARRDTAPPVGAQTWALPLGRVHPVARPNEDTRLVTTLAVPVGQSTIDLPARLRATAAGWIDASTVRLSSLYLPIGQSITERPHDQGGRLGTWIASALPLFTIEAPPSSGEWPLPRRTTPIAQTWIQTRPAFYEDTPTAFVPDLSLPLVRTVPTILRTWTVPSYLVPPPVLMLAIDILSEASSVASVTNETDSIVDSSSQVTIGASPQNEASSVAGITNETGSIVDSSPLVSIGASAQNETSATAAVLNERSVQ